MEAVSAYNCPARFSLLRRILPSTNWAVCFVPFNLSFSQMRDALSYDNAGRRFRRPATCFRVCTISLAISAIQRLCPPLLLWSASIERAETRESRPDQHWREYSTGRDWQ